MAPDSDSRQIDAFAFHLFNLTRAIGMEHGSELLLQLLYLRWAADAARQKQKGDHRLSWQAMRNDIAHDLVRPGRIVFTALSQRLNQPAPAIDRSDDAEIVGAAV